MFSEDERLDDEISGVLKLNASDWSSDDIVRCVWRWSAEGPPVMYGSETRDDNDERQPQGLAKTATLVGYHRTRGKPASNDSQRICSTSRFAKPEMCVKSKTRGGERET